jgi:hypothetical protein
MGIPPRSQILISLKNSFLLNKKQKNDMKLHPNIKIESIASKDKTRCSILNPWIDAENSKLVATNGMAMAVIPVLLEEGDESGYVPCDALKQARKGAKGEISMLCGGEVVLPNGTIMPRDKTETPPNWKIVMPNQDEASMRISLDAGMLAKLAESMGTEGVTLEISGHESPIIVRPACSGRWNATRPACQDAIGVIMPIRQS